MAKIDLTDLEHVNGGTTADPKPATSDSDQKDDSKPEKVEQPYTRYPPSNL